MSASITNVCLFKKMQSAAKCTATIYFINQVMIYSLNSSWTFFK